MFMLNCQSLLCLVNISKRNVDFDTQNIQLCFFLYKVGNMNMLVLGIGMCWEWECECESGIHIKCAFNT